MTTDMTRTETDQMTDTTPRLTPEYAERQARLVAELRDGGHKQIKGQLAKEGGYCCLGVATLVHDRDEDAPDAGVFRWGGYAALDFEVRDYFGFATDAGTTSVVDELGYLTPLSDLNDSYELTFSEIADLIAEGVVLTRDEYAAVGERKVLGRIA